VDDETGHKSHRFSLKEGCVPCLEPTWSTIYY